MMKKIRFLFITIAVILVFRKFFLSGPLVWGDAPYFYKEGLRELVNFPRAWISRGNSLGNINLFLWIYPLMLLYGSLGSFLHLNNDLILRIIFYFPSLIFGFLGVVLTVRNFKFSKTTEFFAILIYLINTYFLLLIDGGQVGVVLAYGLFPFVLWLILRLIDKPTISNFIFALVGSFIFTIVDFRITFICFLTVFILKLREIRKLKVLFLLLISVFGLSLYWIIPSLKLAGSSLSTDVSNLQLTSLLNSMLLYSPNWPTNQFGKVVAPYFYFSILPILIFLPIFISKSRKIVWLTLVFLFFAFLVKGNSSPFGFIYSFLIGNKFGSIFRDSTKFFIPLILIGGILIGLSAEFLHTKLKTQIINIVLFFYILILVWQGIFGQLSGVLGKNPDLASYKTIYQEFNKDNEFFRSVWFTEKSPFAYHLETKQVLDARDLVNFRPFATMNTGTSDKFNFMNNREYLDWFNLLGIKYLILNGNPREIIRTDEEQKDWDRLNSIVDGDKRLEKLNWGTNFPVFENSQIHPQEFFVPSTFLVIGADDVYGKLAKNNPDFSIGNQGFLFLEDGKFDPSNLQNVASTSAVLIFNNKTIDDLKMSFLQKDFIGPTDLKDPRWAIRKSGDYLNWKYELLTKKIDIHEFDYGKGIAFSSIKDESLKFNLNVLEDGNYYLEVRNLSADNSSLKINFNGQESFIKSKSLNNFEWFEKGPINLKKGIYNLEIQNDGGFHVVNVVGLINETDMKIANQLTNNFLGFFPHYDLNISSDLVSLNKILENDRWEKFDSQPTKPGWIIYTDSFNENWKLHKGIEDTNSYPMYSMINGFWFDPKWGDVKIIFKGDEYIRWGVYFSGISLICIVIGILWSYERKNKRNN